MNPLDLTVEGCIFTNSTTTSEGIFGGGAIDTRRIASAQIKNSKFSDCLNMNLGGSIWLNPYESLNLTLTIVECSFKNSTATNSGGAVGAWYVTAAEIKNSQFSNCLAGSCGGSIYLSPNPDNKAELENKLKLTIDGCFFSDSHSTANHGGMIAVWYVTFADTQDSKSLNCSAGQFCLF